MKGKIIICLIWFLGIQFHSEAQIIDIISVIKVAVTKAIKAVDLEVQRLQTQTIWLQNAQKELENTMSELKLNEITGWVQKQRDLFAEYYQELSSVKRIIADYDKVKKIIQLQSAIVTEYQSGFSRFRQDKHFTTEEIEQMFQFYSGILNESLKEANEAALVLNSFVTQMSDADRINIIDKAEKGMQKIYDDLKKFNNENLSLSLERAYDQNDLQSIKNLYGLP